MKISDPPKRNTKKKNKTKILESREIVVSKAAGAGFTSDPNLIVDRLLHPMWAENFCTIIKLRKLI